jgi:prepilin-type N-terminal cleavage/methylation domain-containing protein
MRHIVRRGFTLLELLVVVGIIVLLATILLPMVQRVHTQARRTSMAADLEIISQALEAYKADFGDYPRLDHTATIVQNALVEQGATILCWALVAPGPAVSTNPLNPGDGADGPGFRIRGTVGAVKGPYLPPDRFLIGTADGNGVVWQPGEVNPQNVTQAGFNNNQDVLADRNRSPILYYPATRSAKASEPPNGFVKPMFFPLYPLNAKTATPALVHPAIFNYDDNHVYLDGSHVTPTGFHLGCGNPANLTRGSNADYLAGWRVMSYRLGDANFDGTVDNGEAAVTTGPYFLWSAGPDRVFGNDDDVMCDGAQLQQVMGPLPFQIMPQ